MKKILITACIAVTLSGCVTASEVSTLIPQTAIAIPDGSKLSQAVAVDTLSGEPSGAFKGQVSDEALSMALKEALSQSGMLANSDARYTVLPSLVHLKQPAAGISMKVTATVNYIVKDVDGKIVMEKTISTPYTAKFNEAFAGATRVKRANEGSVRANISEFMEHLVTWANSIDNVASAEKFSINL